MTASAGERDCAELIALLGASNGSPDDRFAAEVAAHLDRCEICSAGELHLARLVSRYCRAIPPELPAAFERRLLDLLCDRRSD